MEQEKTETPTGRRSVVKRALMVVAMLLTAFHLFASFLWIAPASAMRQVIPGNLLSEYMIPLWGQSWSVFAPEPINGDYFFDVRAVIRTPEGTEEITQWVRATDVELDHATYRLFPPRSAGLAIGVASDLKSSWEKLSDDHKEIVKLDYFKGDDSTDRLKAKMQEYGDPEGVIGGYLDSERTASAYATQVADAVWGEDAVVRVQYQASRQNVVPFGKRNDPGAERPPIQVVPTGWRALTYEEHQSNEEFAEYFCASDEVRCHDE
ncbi:hypothetical protein DFO66_10261 [Brevibacterium sanguinis]|uniref:Uncharacterized protein n=2 Tax=Brevibacterium TaxID=1696 RepID=A0A366IPJ0_9MICO|nr:MULTISPECIES: DUF5819 family protein [Brevibacterium]RBP67008.1 hypothetical protein DFO66_10261 [Brevibacterium sanguinis]RBP73533.1 hypothetical protein DFO65_10261 [Brevibacterium celere]